MCGVTWMDQVRKEEVQRIDFMRALAGQADECVAVVWIHGENGGALISEEENRIRCEFKRKATNGMDGWCVNSIA